MTRGGQWQRWRAYGQRGGGEGIINNNANNNYLHDHKLQSVVLLAAHLGLVPIATNAFRFRFH
eukprot:SAG31_NODE_35505_length_322_cov_0.923767_1_plen_62_part_10